MEPDNFQTDILNRISQIETDVSHLKLILISLSIFFFCILCVGLLLSCISFIQKIKNHNKYRKLYQQHNQMHII